MVPEVCCFVVSHLGKVEIVVHTNYSRGVVEMPPWAKPWHQSSEGCATILDCVW